MSGSVTDLEAAAPARPDLEARAIAALLSCVARQGLRKTTLDDVAREAGCGRATLYRYFASKQALLSTAGHAEATRIVTVLRGAAAATDTLEDAVVALLVTAGAELGAHPALRFVADFEPDWLLPHLAFAGGDRFLAAAADALAPAVEPFVGTADAPRAAEWIARVGLCLLCSPTAPVALDDDRSVRRYAREFILPALDPLSVRSPTPTQR
ncbi:MAG TPA: helix-turn-helix domain-containing protein [Acidimicrobiia bacterium]|nr:helix-turn-helix domain-containing protein [Acidimicrobiia bacterium]